MQINVIDYFEKGALLKCRDKVAVKEQSREYTFGEIERFAKNCAALILKKSSDLQPAGPRIPAQERSKHRRRCGHSIQRQLLRKPRCEVSAPAAQRDAAKP